MTSLKSFTRDICIGSCFTSKMSASQLMKNLYQNVMNHESQKPEIHYFLSAKLSAAIFHPQTFFKKKKKFELQDLLDMQVSFDLLHVYNHVNGGINGFFGSLLLLGIFGLVVHEFHDLVDSSVSTLQQRHF